MPFRSRGQSQTTRKKFEAGRNSHKKLGSRSRIGKRSQTKERKKVQIRSLDEEKRAMIPPPLCRLELQESGIERQSRGGRKARTLRLKVNADRHEEGSAKRRWITRKGSARASPAKEKGRREGQANDDLKGKNLLGYREKLCAPHRGREVRVTRPANLWRVSG